MSGALEKYFTHCRVHKRITLYLNDMDFSKWLTKHYRSVPRRKLVKNSFICYEICQIFLSQIHDMVPTIRYIILEYSRWKVEQTPDSCRLFICYICMSSKMSQIQSYSLCHFLLPTLHIGVKGGLKASCYLVFQQTKLFCSNFIVNSFDYEKGVSPGQFLSFDFLRTNFRSDLWIQKNRVRQ